MEQEYPSEISFELKFGFDKKRLTSNIDFGWWGMLLIFWKNIDQKELQFSKRFRSETNSSDRLIVAKRRAKDGRLFFEKIRPLDE